MSSKREKVKIERLDFLEQTGENRFLLEVECSKGTYIRALFEDIAHALGTCAYMSFLERTASGKFQSAGAVTMDEAEALVKAGEPGQLIMPIE